jgi:hypothetical protein
MKQLVIPLPLPDGTPRVVVMPDGSRIPQEGTSVEIDNFIARHIADGALEVVDKKPAKKSNEEK